MVKKIITISIIFGIVILVGIFELLHISASFAFMADRLDTAYVAVEDSDLPLAAEITDEVVKLWERYRILNYTLTNHNTLNMIFSQIANARAYLDSGSDIDALAALRSASFYCRTISSDVIPLLYNLL